MNEDQIQEIVNQLLQVHDETLERFASLDRATQRHIIRLVREVAKDSSVPSQERRIAKSRAAQLEARARQSSAE